MGVVKRRSSKGWGSGNPGYCTTLIFLSSYHWGQPLPLHPGSETAGSITVIVVPCLSTGQATLLTTQALGHPERMVLLPVPDQLGTDHFPGL